MPRHQSCHALAILAVLAVVLMEAPLIAGAEHAHRLHSLESTLSYDRVMIKRFPKCWHSVLDVYFDAEQWTTPTSPPLEPCALPSVEACGPPNNTDIKHTPGHMKPWDDKPPAWWCAQRRPLIGLRHAIHFFSSAQGQERIIRHKYGVNHTSAPFEPLWKGSGASENDTSGFPFDWVLMLDDDTFPRVVQLRRFVCGRSRALGHAKRTERSHDGSFLIGNIIASSVMGGGGYILSKPLISHFVTRPSDWTTQFMRFEKEMLQTAKPYDTGLPLTPIDVCISNTQLGKWCWWHSDWAMTKCSRWARGDEVGDGAYFLQWCPDGDLSHSVAPQWRETVIRWFQTWNLPLPKHTLSLEGESDWNSGEEGGGQQQEPDQLLGFSSQYYLNRHAWITCHNVSPKRSAALLDLLPERGLNDGSDDQITRDEFDQLVNNDSRYHSGNVTMPLY